MWLRSVTHAYAFVCDGDLATVRPESKFKRFAVVAELLNGVGVDMLVQRLPVQQTEFPVQLYCDVLLPVHLHTPA
jgi:hypothetical protein